MFRPMALTVIMALAGRAGAVADLRAGSRRAVHDAARSRRRTTSSCAAPSALYAPVLECRAATARAVSGRCRRCSSSCCGWLATRLGSEFIPSLDEGDLAVQALRIPGTSLTQSLEMQFQLERALTDVPEVKTVFRPRRHGGSGDRPDAAEHLRRLRDAEGSQGLARPGQNQGGAGRGDREAAGSACPAMPIEISQPIQLRFNELISGVRSDLGVKVYGDDLDQLLRSGNEIAKRAEQHPRRRGRQGGTGRWPAGAVRRAESRRAVPLRPQRHRRAGRAGCGCRRRGGRPVVRGRPALRAGGAPAGTSAQRSGDAGAPAHPAAARRLRAARRGRKR